MMKVAGLGVSPAEIEDVLSLHPAIDDVAVVTAPDRLHGEVPKAVIVLRPGATLSASEVRHYCESKLERSKTPRVVEFRKGLPKGPGGKVLYRELVSGREGDRGATGAGGVR
jgi:long-chain acyl-CoA synthetase